MFITFGTKQFQLFRQETIFEGILSEVHCSQILPLPVTAFATQAHRYFHASDGLTVTSLVIERIFFLQKYVIHLLQNEFLGLKISCAMCMQFRLFAFADLKCVAYTFLNIFGQCAMGSFDTRRTFIISNVSS
jgi:hypothetical protein